MVLAQLREQIAVDRREGDATSMSSLSQFALFSLWTRFGHRGGALSEVELKEEERELQRVAQTLDTRGGRRGKRDRLKRPGSLSVIRVVRHSLQPQREVTGASIAKAPGTGNVFVKSTVQFLADPRGVTNLDMLHRALDVTTKALLVCLMRAVDKSRDAAKRQSAAQKRGEEPDKADVLLMRLVGKVCGLQDDKLVPDTPPKSAPAGLGCKFMKQRTPRGQPKPHPGDDYFDKGAPDPVKVVRFLQYYSTWYDSRHMAEFLDRISMVRRAPPLVTARNRS